MSPRTIIPGLPDDWAERPDAADLFGIALVDAIKNQNDDALYAFLELGDRFLGAGSVVVAKLVVESVLSYLVGADRGAGGRRPDLPTLTRLLISKDDPSTLTSAALSLAARVLDAENLLHDALAARQAVARISESGEDTSALVSALVSLGAAQFRVGDVDGADGTARRVLELVDHLEDPFNVAAVRLNILQYELSRGDVDSAKDQAKELRPYIRGLRNGHFSASLDLAESSIDVEQGRLDRARVLVVKALRSARQRHEYPQMVLALGNLAWIDAALGDLKRSVDWLLKARDAAVESGDWFQLQGFEHRRGIALAQSQNYTEAINALQRAVEVDPGDPHERSRTRADIAAVYLAWAHYESENEGDPDEKLGRAESEAESAISQLEQLGDFEWASRGVRTLRQVFERRSYGAAEVDRFAIAAQRYQQVAPPYSGELLRSAGYLALAAGMDQELAISRLVLAAELQAATPQQRAWILADDAAELSDRYGIREVVPLFDAALMQLDPQADSAAFGSLQNDAALAASDNGDNEDAIRRLSEVLDIADFSKNRVLAALATGNLGEIHVRQDANTLAREYLERSARLSVELGDDASAASAWSSVANSWVDEGDLETAEKASGQALIRAERSSSRDALARAKSSAASISYARGKYEESHRLWVECVGLVEERDAGEYQAFALDSLARLGEWRPFKRELDRFARAAQKSGLQKSFSNKLYLSARTWLDEGRPRAAGVVLAYTVLLALDGVMQATRQMPESAARTQASIRSVFGVADALGGAGAFLYLIDLPANSRATLRASYESTIRSIAGEDAQSVIDIVDDMLGDLANSPTHA
ncbi:hypothetical protein [Leifsonia soli]|uniref:Tetratricopeptide (TPR) repeat protein n=1 Tax=Leifsonia soli TaxID=582665 RepID=A0A852T238_9MICO|nr:hypothetical protein [Leifsonia soli]NYD74955.1 tetratricopeptide (TPR) repeat protein [Leifsonia soli]